MIICGSKPIFLAPHKVRFNLTFIRTFNISACCTASLQLVDFLSENKDIKMH